MLLKVCETGKVKSPNEKSWAYLFVFVLAHTCTLAPNTAVVVSTEGTP